MNAQLIVINEKAWQALTPDQREQISKAAAEVRTQGHRDGAQPGGRGDRQAHAASR